MNGLLIRTNGNTELLSFKNVNVLEKLQELVGGYIECLELGNGKMLVVDEDGKFKYKEYNDVASNIYVLMTRTSDYIVGDAILCESSLLE